MKKTRWIYFLLFAVLSLLAGCGGNGNDCKPGDTRPQCFNQQQPYYNPQQGYPYYQQNPQQGYHPHQQNPQQQWYPYYQQNPQQGFYNQQESGWYWNPSIGQWEYYNPAYQMYPYSSRRRF